MWLVEAEDRGDPFGQLSKLHARVSKWYRPREGFGRRERADAWRAELARSVLARDRSLEVHVVPSEDALKHVDVIGTEAGRVAFGRIENELGLDTEVFQRPIQPLGLSDGIVGIVFSVEYQCRGVRIANVCRGRIAREDLRMLPRRAKVPFIPGGAAFGRELGRLIEDTRAPPGAIGLAARPDTCRQRAHGLRIDPSRLMNVVRMEAPGLICARVLTSSCPASSSATTGMGSSRSSTNHI